jgi:D-threo-aldose 1-dehydrogenase
MAIETIHLAGTSIVTSALGLGTTSLLRLPNDQQRLEILDRAFELGIRHYDTAPYYGYSAAEANLGHFLHHRRDRVTVTTKFGIQPPRVAGLPRIADLAKRITRRLPLARRLLAHQATKLVQRNAFSVADAEKSLEGSLRNLGTDYIDIYLLHEAGPAETDSDELLSFLNKQMEKGSIRCFGVGSEFNRVQGVLVKNPAYARVAQFENNVLRRNLEQIPPGTGCAVITHGALGGAYKELIVRLGAAPGIIANWSAQIGVDCSSESVVAGLMLSYAAWANHLGIVLFSTREVRHLEDSVRAIADRRFSDTQVKTFAELAKEIVNDQEQR